MKRFFFMLIALPIIGCTTIDGHVEGWPELKITIHDSNLLEINQKCWKYQSIAQKLLGSFSFGCSIYDLDKKTCDIYVVPNSPEFILDHELAHCKGGDHPDNSLDKFYDHWLDVRAKVSNHYDSTPPKILIDPSGFAYWDHSSKFGIIPKELFSGAQQFCSQLNKNEGVRYVAIGYHPMAQDSDGKTFIGGGYFCVPDDMQAS